MNAPTQVYSLYGLRVCSEVPLPATIARNDQSPYDLRVSWDAEPLLIDAAPAGRRIAELRLDNGRGYTLMATGHGCALYFHQTGVCWIAPDLHAVRIQLAPHIDPGVAGLLASGNVIACVLSLRGESVLHASAVELDGQALAFLGGSGMGKSSLAAVLCAYGAQLVTDDVLRLHADHGHCRCFSGTGQLRLRQNAQALAEHFPAVQRNATPDERIAINLTDTQTLPRLGAIVIPRLARNCQALKLERIPPARALLYLMAYPRIQESSQKSERQRQLDFLGRIAVSVPLFTAEIPWGLPLPRTLAAELIEGIGAIPVP